MKNFKLKTIKNGLCVASAALMIALSPFINEVWASDFDSPVRTKVFSENEDGSRYYRIPGVAVTNDGTIVAVADRRGDSNSDLPNVISVVSKYSTDYGQTWSEAVVLAEGKSSTETYGDPAVVYDPDTNTLVCVFSGDKGFWYGTYNAPCGFYVCKSFDNGKTWTDPINIQSQIYKRNWRGAFCASGSMLRLTKGEHKGRIMFVANVNTSSSNDTKYVKEYVCYSDDLGDNWAVANNVAPRCDRGNESKLVELEDGTLLMSIRYPGTRMFTKSTDGGATWSEVYSSGLVAQDCNGAIMLYPSADGKSRLLHSYLNNPTTRIDATVSVSYDGGDTWPVSKCFVKGYSGYSDLCVLPDGSLGLFVEDGNEHSNGANGGYELVFIRFDLNYLTGEDSKVESAEMSMADEKFYDLNGCMVPSIDRTGIYIRHHGSKAEKVIVKK